MSEPPTATDRPEGYRVLVIDDELTIRVALRRCFTRMGWTVEEAANGESGYALIVLSEQQPAAARYHLIVCDLRMPGLDGIQLHDRLAATHPTVLPRVVIATGDIVSQEAAVFVERSGCEVIQKPFELAALRALAQRVAAQAAGV